MKNRFSGLVVDDDASVREVLSNRLENREGYEIFQASNGLECLRLADEMQPDFILLDLVMPEMNGLEVLEKLKSEPRTSAIPVFMLTSKSKMKNVEMALEAGASGYICKPVRVWDIVKKIRAQMACKD